MKTLSFESLKEKWPSTYVARTEVSAFSGGLLNPRSLANADCLGEGPQGRIRFGRKIAYEVDSLVSWMEQKASMPENRKATE